MKPIAGPQLTMFLTINRRAAMVRNAGILTALFAMIVAAAVVTAILNLYEDVGSKIQREFRSYGANLIVTTPSAQPLPAGALKQIRAVLGGRGTAVPFAYALAHSSSGTAVVAAGTEMEEVRRMNAWWNVSTWPSGPFSALVGDRAQPALSPKGEPFELSFSGRTIQLRTGGVLHTGADEDSRIYIPLAEFEQWTGVAPSTVEVAATGPPAEIEAIRRELALAFPGLEVRPVRQIVETEAHVLEKTRGTLLASTLLIVATAALCVLATLMAWRMEQRKNVALMKALGASSGLINALFAAQAVLLGAAGAVLGFVLGIGVAAWIGKENFHAIVLPRLSVFPPVLAGSIAVALLAAWLPVSLLRKVQPAAILRGE